MLRSNKELNEKITKMRKYLEDNKKNTFTSHVREIKKNYWNNYSDVEKVGIIEYLSIESEPSSDFSEVKNLITYATSTILAFVAIISYVTINEYVNIGKAVIVLLCLYASLEVISLIKKDAPKQNKYLFTVLKTIEKLA